jgi:hypothetical protein
VRGFFHNILPTPVSVQTEVPIHLARSKILVETGGLATLIPFCNGTYLSTARRSWTPEHPLRLALTIHSTITCAGSDPQSRIDTTFGYEDVIYSVVINGPAYKVSSSRPGYTLVQSRSTAESRYTVVKHGDGFYSVRKHIASSPNGTITFSVKKCRTIYIVQRDYGSSGNVKAYYSITKRPGEFALGCFHQNVLAKMQGYTQQKLDADAFMTFDTGLFVCKLEEMEGNRLGRSSKER